MYTACVAGGWCIHNGAVLYTGWEGAVFSMVPGDGSPLEGCCIQGGRTLHTGWEGAVTVYNVEGCCVFIAQASLSRASKRLKTGWAGAVQWVRG